MPTLAPDAAALIFLIGAVLYIGLIASYLFIRHHVSDVIVLIGIGLLLGPVSGLARPDLFAPWMPVAGAVALSLILFEGGLALDIKAIVERFGLAFALATATFWLTFGLIAVLYKILTGAPWMHGFLLGATLGCVSSAVILPVSSVLKVPPHTKTTIHLEAALSVMWGVVVTLVLIRLVPLPVFSLGQISNAVIGAFAVAVLGAGLFGVVWVAALSRLKESPFSYMMTLAAVFVLYGLTEFLHGAGPVAALAFGIILANAEKIARFFGKDFSFVLDEHIRRFNTQVTFFVRTLFFVYLGVVVSLGQVDARVLTVLAAIFFSILLVRAVVTKAVLGVSCLTERAFSHVYMAMMPRGLISAVLVGMVQARVPGTENFLEIAFGVILLTNILMSWWIHRSQRASPVLSPAPADDR